MRLPNEAAEAEAVEHEVAAEHREAAEVAMGEEATVVERVEHRANRITVPLR